MSPELCRPAEPDRRLPVVEIVKTFRFEAAHRLPRVPHDHPCGRVHGHSYRVELHLRGEVDPDSGWVVDFGEVSALARPVIGELDHACLNDLPGLENPTSENLCLWLAARLGPRLPALHAVVVRETETSASRFRLAAAGASPT